MALRVSEHLGTPVTELWALTRLTMKWETVHMDHIILHINNLRNEKKNGLL